MTVACRPQLPNTSSKKALCQNKIFPQRGKLRKKEKCERGFARAHPGRRSGRRRHAPAGAKPALPGANCRDVAAGRCEVLLVSPSSTTRLRCHSADHTITVDSRTAPSSRRRGIDIRSPRPSIDRGRLRCRTRSEPPMPPPCSTPATTTNRPDRSPAGRPPR